MTSEFVPQKGFKFSSSVSVTVLYGLLSVFFTFLWIYLILGQPYGLIFTYQSVGEKIMSIICVLFWMGLSIYFFKQSLKDIKDAREMEKIIKEERHS